MRFDNLSFPPIIRIEPSSACNLRCLHCPTGTEIIPRGVMSDAQFCRIIERIRGREKAIRGIVLYHGGEPLLNKNIFIYAKTLRTMEIPFIKTVSNGMLVNDDILYDLCAGNIDSIEISLDAGSVQENDFIRKNADALLIIKNIKKIIDYKKKYYLSKPLVYISSTQFAVTETDSIPSIPQWLVDCLGTEYLSDIEGIKTVWAMVWPSTLMQNKQLTNRPNGQIASISKQCDQLQNMFTIRWNGDVVQCCYDLTSKGILGNINTESIENIWNGLSLMELRAAIENGNPVGLCRQCIVTGWGSYMFLNNLPIHNNL